MNKHVVIRKVPFSLTDIIPPNCRLILASPVLEDINLDQNSIGDGGARELLHGLQQRKEDGLPMLKLTVTAIQISPDTFQKITELSSQPKKKKKRGKKVSE